MWNAYGISELDVEKTLERMGSQNGSNLAKFSCSNHVNFSRISCSCSNFHAFIPALLLFVSERSGYS